MTNWLDDDAPDMEDLLGQEGEEPVGDAALGGLGEAQLARVQGLIDHLLQESESARAEHVALADEYQRIYDLTPYEQSELLSPSAESIRTPTTTARVDQMVGSMTGALCTEPLSVGTVEDGADGTVAKHVESAINERLSRAAATTYVSSALRGTAVTTIGYIKTSVVNVDGSNEFELEGTRMQDVYLVPHSPRNIDDCTMVAERSFETLMNLRRLADDGFYDPAAVESLGEGGDAAPETPDHEFFGTRPDSESIEVLEVYVRVRNVRENRDAGGETMYRVFYARQRAVVLRAEEWTDGFPYRPIRHDRSTGTIYARAYPAILRDINYAADQLISAALEQDRLTLSSLYAINPASSAWTWINQRLDDGEVAIQGGEVIAADPSQVAIFNHAPTPMQVNDRANLLENYANLATISAMPFQTVRAATEVRFVAGQIQQQEQQMLRALRADLDAWLEYAKRLMWKYMTHEVDPDLLEEAAPDPSLPAPEEDAGLLGNEPTVDDDLAPLDGVLPPTLRDAATNERWLVHGTKAARINEAAFRAVRLSMRGTSTQADQILAQQSSSMLMTAVLPQLLQKAAMEQAGVWAEVWDVLRRICEAHGIQDYVRFLGPDPRTDPNVIDFAAQIDPARRAALGMQLAQGAGGAGRGAGQFQAMQAAFGQAGPGAPRGDGTVTSQPGGPAANGLGLF